MYPSASRLRLYTHVTRRLAGAPVRGAGRCATPATCGAHDSRPHTREIYSQTERERARCTFSLLANAQWRDMASTRAPSASHSTACDWGPSHQSSELDPVSLAIGSRRASGLRHHPRGKMHSAFARATAASLANSFADRLPSVAPRQGVMRPASRRTASLIAKRGWINAMDQGDGSPHSLTLSWSLCGVCKLRCCFHIDARVA